MKKKRFIPWTKIHAQITRGGDLHAILQKHGLYPGSYYQWKVRQGIVPKPKTRKAQLLTIPLEPSKPTGKIKLLIVQGEAEDVIQAIQKALTDN